MPNMRRGIATRSGIQKLALFQMQGAGIMNKAQHLAAVKQEERHRNAILQIAKERREEYILPEQEC